MKLTAKQKRFVQEYLIDLNATQAAIRAGYSKKSAHSIGPENLEKPEIKQAIEEKLKQIDEEMVWKPSVRKGEKVWAVEEHHIILEVSKRHIAYNLY